MRGLAAFAGVGAVMTACFCAPAMAIAAGPPAPAAAPVVLPLWIDPQLLGAPAPAKAAPAKAAPIAAAPAKTNPTPVAAAATPRFTVTRIGADGARVTQAIDASTLQALGRPSAVAAPASAVVAVLPPVVAQAAPAPPPPAPVKQAAPAPSAAAAAPAVVATAAARSQDAAVEAAALQAAQKRLTLEPTWTALARRPLGAESATLAPDDRKKADGKASLTGVRDGRAYGETGRFYLYAAMKNKGVGMNVVDHGENWSGDGLSYDQGGFAGQRSAGIGWRKGDISTSLGWVHAKNPINGLYGAPAEKDDRLSLIFTWRPKAPQTAPPLSR